LMVTLVILGLSVVFIYQIFVTQHDSYIAQQDVSETQQDVRASLDMITRDLRSTGFGVPGGGTGITDTTDNALDTTDSITFQTAQPSSTAVSTFLTADAASSTVNVNSTTGFLVGNRVNLVSVVDKSAALYTVNAVVSGTVQLVLNATPTAKQGDLVVSADSNAGAVDTITYALVDDPDNPGTYLLQRTSALGGVTETLADHILDLQLQYRVSGSAVDVNTVSGTALDTIRMVKVTLTTQTLKNLAKPGSGAESGYRLGRRSLTAFIVINNSISTS